MGGAIHSEVVWESTVAASSLCNEIVAAGVCEGWGLATEPRVVTAGRRPVVDIAGVPHELIRWTAGGGEQIAACLADLEHEYVTGVDDEGELKYLPAVSERARVELMRIAAYKTRPPRQKRARSLAQLRADWKQCAIDIS
ncbi:relaxase domain-containing protein [Streptomyces sp. NPDC091267]|uniref:relaxase domain-containing protein n=1 Tax=Streptomyces sp. NPDC091267 TaxID=3155195 RepID=UPI0034189A66